MSIRRSRALLVVALTIAFAGCSRDRSLGCEPAERYAGSVNAPPLRVPDDLNVPDETEALRVPDRNLDAETGPWPGLPCLESPPDFFEGAGAPD